jgi:hypothetical protein
MSTLPSRSSAPSRTSSALRAAKAPHPRCWRREADALAQSLKQTDYLRKCLKHRSGAPRWRSVRAPTKFAPIEGERIAGTNRVRIRFTDDTAERARAGAEAAVAALQPIDGQSAKDAADVVERTLGSLVAREKQFNEQVEAMKAQEAADLATVANTPATISPAGSANRALALRWDDRHPAHCHASWHRPRAHGGGRRTSWRMPRACNGCRPATTPRIASNQPRTAVHRGRRRGRRVPAGLYRRVVPLVAVRADRHDTGHRGRPLHDRCGHRDARPPLSASAGDDSARCFSHR